MKNTKDSGSFHYDYKIEGIKIYKKTRRVEINASSNVILRINEQSEIRRSFKEKFEGFDVEINFKFKTDLSVESILYEFKDSMLLILSEKMPSSKGMLKDSIWEVTETGKLLIKLKTNGVSLLKEKKCDEAIKDIFENNFSKKINVEFMDAALNEEYKKGYLEFKESEESKILAAAENETAKNFLSNKIPGDAKARTAKNEDKRKTSAVIKGKNFADDLDPISQIGNDTDSAAISGKIFKTEFVSFKNKMNMCKFFITDESGSLTVKFFYKKENDDELKALIKDRIHVKVRGDMKYDSFEDERVLNAKDIVAIPEEIRSDNAEAKRVELHLHTRMSSMDGVSTVESLVGTAAKWGHKAIAITDHGVVQAFPDAFKAGEKAGIKIIYGVECYLLDDDAPVFYFKEGQEQDGSYVVFDVETTGLDPIKDKITEIGAVRVSEGIITGGFKSFVNPGVHIPEKITKITGITDAMVRDAPPVKPVLEKFMEFAGKSILAAHNSRFDMSFIKKAASDEGIEIDNPVCDTLQMSRLLIPGLPNYRLGTVAEFLGINTGDSHRAHDDAAAAAGVLVRCLDILKAKGICDYNDVRRELDWNVDFTKNKSYHAVILVKNQIGLRNLYELISYSHLRYFRQKKPRIPRRLLMSYREGLLVTTACENGELYTAVKEDRPQKTIEHIAEFYDFLEIQPLGNNRFLIKCAWQQTDMADSIPEVDTTPRCIHIHHAYTTRHQDRPAHKPC
ncbi:MAG: PHP domain-containing protein, partial [Eubacteriales bacterium]|nr:PHP domain-containing protein [Eubacteriales bacterium]